MVRLALSHGISEGRQPTQLEPLPGGIADPQGCAPDPGVLKWRQIQWVSNAAFCGCPSRSYQAARDQSDRGCRAARAQRQWTLQAIARRAEGLAARPRSSLGYWKRSRRRKPSGLGEGVHEPRRMGQARLGKPSVCGGCASHLFEFTNNLCPAPLLGLGIEAQPPATTGESFWPVLRPGALARRVTAAESASQVTVPVPLRWELRIAPRAGDRHRSR